MKRGIYALNLNFLMEPPKALLLAIWDMSDLVRSGRVEGVRSCVRTRSWVV
jgi:hypothetical protein